MAVDLRCPNCGDNLGKDVENPQPAWCGTCGSHVYNERGDRYPEEETEEEKEFLRKNKPRGMTGGSLIRRW